MQFLVLTRLVVKRTECNSLYVSLRVSWNLKFRYIRHCTNFPKIYDPPPNSRCQKGEMKTSSILRSNKLSRHCNKTSQQGDQASTICAHLHVSNKEQFCAHLTVNTAGVQYKQWLHNVFSRNNRCFLCDAYEMHTFTMWQNAEILILKYSKIPLIQLARDRIGAE